MKLRVALTALVAVTTIDVVASAQQPWIKDRRFGEGVGIRAGNLELHPGLAAEFGYDSNYFQRASGEGPNGEGPVGFYRMRITPHLNISTLSPQRRLAEGLGEAPAVNFRAGVYASYNELITADSSKAESGSDYRHVGAGANFLVDIAPERPFGADVYGDYLRAVEPSNSPEESLAFNRDSFRGGAGVNWRPAGGLFTWRLGYEGNYNLFERTAFESFNNARHFIKTRTRWRFLPRTAIISDAEYGIIRFGDSTTTQNNGETLQARLGINGLVTNHFAVLAMGGWATTFYKESASGVRAQNYDGPVGAAEVRWFIMPAPTLEATSAAVGLSSIAAGYTRNFNTSYLGSFYVRDRGYLNVSYLLGGMFVLTAEAGYSHISYPDSFYPTRPPPNTGGLRAASFGENRLDAMFFAEYRLSDSVGINTTLRYDQNMSESIPLSPGGPSDNLDFKRFQAFLGLRLFW